MGSCAMVESHERGPRIKYLKPLYVKSNLNIFIYMKLLKIMRIKPFHVYNGYDKISLKLKE